MTLRGKGGGEREGGREGGRERRRAEVRGEWNRGPNHSSCKSVGQAFFLPSLPPSLSFSPSMGMSSRRKQDPEPPLTSDQSLLPSLPPSLPPPRSPYLHSQPPRARPTPFPVPGEGLSPRRSWPATASPLPTEGRREGGREGGEGGRSDKESPESSQGRKGKEKRI